MADEDNMVAPAEIPVKAPLMNGSNGTSANLSHSSDPLATNAVNSSHSSDPSTSNVNTEANLDVTAGPGLTTDEIELYDRQIRLWGAQAQQRIQSANILLVSLRGVGTEIAKNLTCAGVRSLTIVDDEVVTEEDLGAQWFLRESDIGGKRAEAAIPRIRELNSRVTITADGGLQDLLMKDQNYYAPFDCVIACDHDIMTLSTINTAARFANRPFYCAGIHGYYGYIFADLVCHEYVIEREQSNVATQLKAESITRSIVGVATKKEKSGKITEIVKKVEKYCPLILANTSPLPPHVLNSPRKLRNVSPLLPCLRALFEFERDYSHFPNPSSAEDLGAFTILAHNKLRELQLAPDSVQSDFLRRFIQNMGAELPPTASFIGGRLSEDVINVLGKREQPLQNFALFDGFAMEGTIYCLYSPPPELAMHTFNPMMALPLDIPADVPADVLENAPADIPADVSVDMQVDSGGSQLASSNVPLDIAAESTAPNDTTAAQ